MLFLETGEGARTSKTILGRGLEESVTGQRLPIKQGSKLVHQVSWREKNFQKCLCWKIHFSSHINDAKAALGTYLGTTIVVFASLSVLTSTPPSKLLAVKGMLTGLSHCGLATSQWLEDWNGFLSGLMTLCDLVNPAASQAACESSLWKSAVACMYSLLSWGGKVIQMLLQSF